MEDKELYVIAVLRYKDENSNLTEEDLFPLDWNNSYDYHLKIEIIAEAIQKGILVKDTELYQQEFIKNKCKILTPLPKNE